MGSACLALSRKIKSEPATKLYEEQCVQGANYLIPSFLLVKVRISHNYACKSNKQDNERVWFGDYGHGMNSMARLESQPLCNYSMSRSRIDCYPELNDIDRYRS